MPGSITSVFIVLFMLPCKGLSMCSKNICLQWTITENSLKLICQITDIYLSVSIADPNSNILAECIPPIKNSCEAFYRNGTIQYNVLTNEVILTVRGTINNDLDGYWACHHGLKGDRTVAFVSVNNRNGTYIYPVKTTTQSQMISTKTEQSKGLEASTINGTSVEAKSTRNSITTSSFIAKSTNVTNNINEEYGHRSTQNKVNKKTKSETDNINEEYGHRSTQNKVNKKTKSETELKHIKIYGPLAVGLVLFLCLFVGMNIWISRKCRSVNLKNGEDFIGPNISNRTSNVNTDTQPPQSENDLSDYEMINENEMIQVPDNLGMPNEIEAISVSSSSITSDSTKVSDRSYLEVVDYSFYLNSYETLQRTGDSDSVHVYSTTLDQSEFKLDFSSTEATKCSQCNCRYELKQKIVTDFPEQSSLLAISDRSTVSDDNLIADRLECGASKTSPSSITMDTWNISYKAKTNLAMQNSLSKSISNNQDMSDADSNQFIETQSSCHPINAMSTFL